MERSRECASVKLRRGGKALRGKIPRISQRSRDAVCLDFEIQGLGTFVL